MQKPNSRIEKLIAMNKARAIHGRANSRLTGYADRTYGIWQAFRDRCNNPNRKDYHRYGGRGITYDPAWNNFSQFVHDMGCAPEGKSLDRIDNDKGYYKDNCRWATRKEQSHNSTRVKYITIAGETKRLTEWLQTYQVSKNSYYRRVKLGWSIEQAIKTPMRKIK